MSNRVLVTYATFTGSTAGVAEAIGQTLSEHGLDAEVHPMHEVTDLTPYDAVVAGSAIQAKAWLPEAMQFIEKNRAALAAKPFAAFLVCSTLALKNKSMREKADVGSWLAPVRALIKPVSEGLFAGIIEPKKIPIPAARFGFRVSILLGIFRRGDNRDWSAIRAWASELPAKLGRVIA